MKNVQILLLALFAPTIFMAQSNTLTGEEVPQEEQVNAMKIMVIPFHATKFYFSDCDRDLAAHSRVDRENVRFTFQASMDYASEQWMEKKYEPINLFQLKDSVSKASLKAYYDNVSYSMDVPTRAITKKKNPLKKWAGKISEATGIGQSAEEVKEEEMDSYTVIESEDNEYMSVRFKNREFFDLLNENYGADYYVTINQFEVKTDYAKCIDREHGKFTRRIKVHYNVLTPEGEVVYGDVVTAKYNSNSNKMHDIIQNNFGFLAEYITQTLP